MWMVLGSVLYSVVGPFLYLTGLASTDVPTAAITQRMESLNFLFLSYIFLGASISSWTMVNASLTLCGIILAVISPVFWGDSVKVSTGALFILLSGYAFSSSLLISKKYLSKISVGVLAVFRVLLGSVLYHFLVLALGENLGNLYSSKLWIAMAPYGFVYVFGGQICWLLALQKASPISISMGTTFLFVLTLCWSAALLGVLPTTAQWIGSAFLVTSILSSVVEVRYKALESAQESAIKGELEEPLPIAAHTTTNSNPIHATAGDVSYKRSQSYGNEAGANRTWSTSAICSEVIVPVGDFDALSNEGGFKGF
mmetsp:Transcript_18261/g.26680  ORF Transcript_18261/g.26680 Transcript_18261/m.26680 type:complete len:312 (+) Transcript_18261:473-1408(+)